MLRVPDNTSPQDAAAECLGKSLRKLSWGLRSHSVPSASPSHPGVLSRGWASSAQILEGIFSVLYGNAKQPRIVQTILMKKRTAEGIIISD